ncbi:MAG: hypothetical protein ACK54Z_04220 [Cyanobacteriota bacterium]|jgi:hypothetical protein
MKQSSRISIILLGFFLYSLCSGLPQGQGVAKPSTQLSPEFRSIVEAALSLRKAEFTIIGSSVKVKTKQGELNVPLQDLQTICTSHPEENCLAFAIAFFSGVLNDNQNIIGPLGSLLKHKDELDPFDPRLPLLRYHQLREDEVEEWRQSSGQRRIQLIEFRQRKNIDALLAKKIKYSANDESSFININPNEVDASIELLVRMYRAASADGQAYIRSQISSDQGWALLTFSKRAAVQATQPEKNDLVSDGLTALAIDNLAQGDVRDSLVAISILYHVARSRNIDTTQLLNRTAAISGSAMAAVFFDFLKRDDLDRVHLNMGWREVAGPKGIGYIWDVNTP